MLWGLGRLLKCLFVWILSSMFLTYVPIYQCFGLVLLACSLEWWIVFLCIWYWLFARIRAVRPDSGWVFDKWSAVVDHFQVISGLRFFLGVGLRVVFVHCVLSVSVTYLLLVHIAHVGRKSLAVIIWVVGVVLVCLKACVVLFLVGCWLAYFLFGSFLVWLFSYLRTFLFRNFLI